jgi:hypothetical protein
MNIVLHSRWMHVVVVILLVLGIMAIFERGVYLGSHTGKPGHHWNWYR